jgi:nicotinamide riboside kinase
MFALLYLPKGEYVYDGIRSYGNKLIRLDFETECQAKKLLEAHNICIMDFSIIRGEYDNIFTVESLSGFKYSDDITKAIIKQKHLFEVVKVD